MAPVEVAAPPEVHEPLLAHHGAPGWRTDPIGPAALCGVRLIGVPVPDGYAHVCGECIAIHEGFSSCGRLDRTALHAVSASGANRDTLRELGTSAVRSWSDFHTDAYLFGRIQVEVKGRRMAHHCSPCALHRHS